MAIAPPLTPSSTTPSDALPSAPASASGSGASGSGSGSGRRASKTVVVLGASYGGARAARLLSQELPSDWRLVVVDRNSHMNHVYVFPRFTVLPSHAPKAYIPYKNHLNPAPAPQESLAESGLPTPPLTPTSSANGDADASTSASRHTWIQASVTSLTSHSVTFTRPGPVGEAGHDSHLGIFDGPEETLEFDYAVYALGAGLPDPVNVWKPAYSAGAGAGANADEDAGQEDLGAGSKRCGVRLMQLKAAQFKRAERIVIVGAGALGIQYATDLKAVYPGKTITLLHSRQRLMPLYPIDMHTTIVEHLASIGVDLILGERVVTWPLNPECLDGEDKIITTDKGRTFTADLVLPCTGQKPHVAAIAALCPSVISPTSSRIRVHPTMQVSPGPLRPAATRANTLERLGALSLHPAHETDAEHERERGYAPEGEIEVEEDHHPDLSHIFAVGDCAQTGAIQAGHTAYYQAEVAARNVLRLVRDEGEELEEYKVSVPAIKVTLGLTKGVISNAEGTKVSDEGVEDLHAMVMWPSFQCEGLDVNA